MKFPDPNQFNFKQCTIAGDECVLITPKDMGVTWTDDNKIFRSSVWRLSDNKLISAGFRKFVNLGEAPDFEPVDFNTEPHTAVIKRDGSCLIVSRHRGELVVRTRGTVDASLLPNGHEIQTLREKYPRVFNNRWLDSENITLLFEWTTPSNRIVLNESNTPTLWMIGAVFHEDYSYMGQYQLCNLGLELGVNRPGWICMDSFAELQAYVKVQTDIEGVVVYSQDGQTLKKIKTDEYIRKHRVFTGIKTVDHVFELWTSMGSLPRSEFEVALSQQYDWELVVALKDLMDEMFLRWKRIDTQLGWIRTFVDDSEFRSLNRKSQAARILDMFPDRSGVAFALLDGRVPEPAVLWKTFKDAV